MDKREKALNQIKKLAEENQITLDEVRAVLQQSIETTPVFHGFELSGLLAYMGGILIFAGVGVYTAMFWESITSLSRIILTLGAGLSCYSVALGLSTNPRYEKVTQALFVVSATLQPLGLFVFLYEIYGASTDSHVAILFAFGIMFIQQLATFWEKRLSLLLFFILIFGLGFFITLFDYIGVKESYTAMGLGTSLFLIVNSLRNMSYRPVIGLWYFLSTFLFLGGAFDYLYDTNFEASFAALCGLTIYISVVVRSKTILFTSSFFLLAYIGRYTWLHFVDSVGWPISLIIIGVAFVFLSGFALKLQKKYM